MRNKIELLSKQMNENRKKAEALRAEVSQLETLAAELDAKAEQAAEAGDIESYKALKLKAADAAAALYVKRANVKKFTSPCTKEDALAAWAEFQCDHDAAFNKALKEYAAEVKAQRARFMAIIGMQTRAREQRYLVAKLAGMSDPEALDALKFACVDGAALGADRAYYLSKKEITVKESTAALNAFMCTAIL